MITAYEGTLVFAGFTNGRLGTLRERIRQYLSLHFPDYEIRGLENDLSDIWITYCAEHIDAFTDRDEPYESLVQAIAHRTKLFTEYLETSPPSLLSELQAAGVRCFVSVDTAINFNESEFTFPVAFLCALSTRGLSLQIYSSEENIA